MYQRVWAEIDLGALVKNVRVIREKIGPDVRVMAVIKANAYGHSVEIIVPKLLQLGVDAFAVACPEEGVAVRKIIREQRPEDPDEKYMILVLGYTDEEEYGKALEYGIDLNIYDAVQGEKLSQNAARCGKIANVHIKLETGMNRVGFACSDESAASICHLAGLPGLKMRGVFTHFARCDEVSKENAEQQQIKFENMICKLKGMGVEFEVRHSANSASIIEYPRAFESKDPSKTEFIARAGIMLYGLYPSDEMDREETRLYPVMSVKTHVVHLKEIGPGEAVGYGGTYVTDKVRKVATVPIGYGDGYPRHLSNQGWMLVHGKIAPILGRVCMDQTMIDVTDIPETKLMDEVTVFGEGLLLEELAKVSGTIHYEILCQLTDRIIRKTV